jgi:hypothetical protein
VLVYSTTVAAARLAAVRDFADGGAFEISDGASATVLVLVRITSARVDAEARARSFATTRGQAIASGAPTHARLLDRYGGEVAAGLVIGREHGDLIVDRDRLQAGMTVRVMSAVIRHP